MPSGLQQVLRTVGSLWFAAVIMTLLMASMASATVFESINGTEMALADFYYAPWFEVLLILFALNVLAAALAPGIGVAVGAAIALGGFLVLPARRQKAVEAFEASVRSTRDAVLAATRETVAAEAERASAAVLDAFTPFHDFYESRRRSLAEVRAEVAGLREATAALRADLG